MTMLIIIQYKVVRVALFPTAVCLLFGWILYCFQREHTLLLTSCVCVCACVRACVCACEIAATTAMCMISFVVDDMYMAMIFNCCDL